MNVVPGIQRCEERDGVGGVDEDRQAQLARRREDVGQAGIVGSTAYRPRR